MAITKGTKIGRRNGPEIDSVQGYDWFVYCSNELAHIVQCGHHKPTIEQMLEAGCMIVADPDHDLLTHKLVPDSWSDDGITVKQNVIEKTSEEKVQYAEDIFNQKAELFRTEIQKHLDTTAKSWGYDNIISLCTYEGNSHPKYSAEGWAGKSWRSQVWSYCEIELAKIEAGTRPEPESVEAFVAELPTITRPIA